MAGGKMRQVRRLLKARGAVAPQAFVKSEYEVES